MTTPLVMVGAGGHGRERFDVVEPFNELDARFELLGFLDGAPDRPDSRGSA